MHVREEGGKICKVGKIGDNDLNAKFRKKTKKKHLNSRVNTKTKMNENVIKLNKRQS